MQKKIIIFIVALFILSSAYLLAVGNKFNDLNFGQNWWAVYFENPRDNSLNFVIENHGEKTDFHYVIYQDKEKLTEDDIKIENGRSQRLNLDESLKADQRFSLGAASENKKITVEVSSGDEKKEIYKNFLK